MQRAHRVWSLDGFEVNWFRFGVRGFGVWTGPNQSPPPGGMSQERAAARRRDAASGVGG